ncbi:hypothetical protein [Arhodomonas sp. AD133]|uniref:hypothetical protein n=1 Tax=Arhodomonas sp. AD133 TaxID=3415009 RepID=UPI003EB9CDC4
MMVEHTLQAPAGAALQGDGDVVAIAVGGGIAVGVVADPVAAAIRPPVAAVGLDDAPALVEDIGGGLRAGIALVLVAPAKERGP